jgi:hypothetical protein
MVAALVRTIFFRPDQQTAPDHSPRSWTPLQSRFPQAITALRHMADGLQASMNSTH